MLRLSEAFVALNAFKHTLQVIDRTKAVTQHFLENSFKKTINTKENEK